MCHCSLLKVLLCLFSENFVLNQVRISDLFRSNVGCFTTNNQYFKVLKHDRPMKDKKNNARPESME